MSIVDKKSFEHNGETLFSVATLEESASGETGKELVARIYEDPDGKKPVTGHGENTSAREGGLFEAAERKASANILYPNRSGDWCLQKCLLID